MSDVWEELTPLAQRELRDDHQSILVDESGIDESVVEGRGYYSPGRVAIKRLVDRKIYEDFILKAKSWLAIPVFRPDGTKHCEIIRLVGFQGKAKYVYPSGYRNALDIHPEHLEYLADPSYALIFVEGIKKADAVLSAALAEDIDCVVVGVNGCWGWKVATSGGSISSPDFLDIPMDERRIVVIPDSDYRTNDSVRAGWSGCATYLSSKTKQHYCSITVPPATGLDKQGADDYLVSGNSLRELLSAATSPKHALLDEEINVAPTLDIRTGMQLIRRAADKIPHVITPILPEQSIVVMAGQAGSLKTWHAAGLVLDLATGNKWLDHPDFEYSEGRFSSLYVNKEMGGTIFENRLKKLARAPRYQDLPDWEKSIDTHVFSPDKLAGFDLLTEKSRDRLEEAILQFGIDLVILDSLSMSWSGNENDNTEVGQFYGQLRAITERTRAIWLILHHTLKPANTRKKDSIMFSIRGAGNIVQQADTAMIFDPNLDSISGHREITVKIPKTRTDKEPEPFITSLQDHDGLYITLNYVTQLTQHAAKVYGSNPTSMDKLTTWIATELPNLPAVRPTGPGIRTQQLIALLRMAWPDDTREAPSEDTIRKALIAMGTSGQLEVKQTDKRNGNLYRLPDPNSEPEEDETLANEYLNLEDEGE